MWVEKYTAQVGKENILIYPVGRKMADAVKKLGFTPMGDYQHMSGKPNYREASELAAELMKRFVRGEIQQVELLYNHFKSTSTQVLTQETFLPVDLGVSNHPDEDTEETFCGGTVTAIAPEGTASEALYGFAGFGCFGTCGPHDGHADGHGQCQRPDSGLDVDLQQEPSASHHERTAGYCQRFAGVIR